MLWSLLRSLPMPTRKCGVRPSFRATSAAEPLPVPDPPVALPPLPPAPLPPLLPAIPLLPPPPPPPALPPHPTVATTPAMAITLRTVLVIGDDVDGPTAKV